MFSGGTFASALFATQMLRGPVRPPAPSEYFGSGYFDRPGATPTQGGYFGAAHFAALRLMRVGRS